MFRKIFFLSVFLLFAPAMALADLTGTWQGDDGGTYYLRQIGNTLHWYGERDSNNPSWSNVFRGQVQGGHVNGAWADVPKGQYMNHGQLRLDIRNNGNVLVAVHKTGGFGGSRWTRAGYVQPAPQPAVPLQPLSEDCVNFNPATTQVRRINGRWKIVDGSHWLFDFGNNRQEARRSLRVIKHYQANHSCFVGRPGPSFTYLKSGGQAPGGQMAGEDCVGFNPSTAQVQHINGRWKIVDGSHWMFDFGPQEDEARKSLRIIKHYGFNRSCFVGRPDPSFKYLRK